MPQENLTKQEEKTVKVPLVNPFLTRKVRGQRLLDLGCHPVYRASSMQVDEKTHQTAPVFEEYDLREEIVKCKSLAGVDYMKRLLATGQAKPEDFYDDGKSGLDTTLFPSNVHEAREKANEGNDELAKIAAALGATEEGITQKSLEDLLKAKIKTIWEEQQAQANKITTEGGAM